MAFSLEHAEAASEVADIILASLLVNDTPVPRKVARLHLICDILHNSATAVPSAWKFRQEFQSRLGIVFDHLSAIYHSFPGRITAETFKKQFTIVVDVWEDWLVFPPDFTKELRERLEGNLTKPTEPHDETKDVSREAESGEQGTKNSKFKPSSFQPATAAPVLVNADSDIDGVPMDDDIDGVPMDDDIDGVPIDDGIDGVPMDDDIDGVPMDDDLDGVPMEDDIDGAPMQDPDAGASGNIF
jgi:U2-associated protein SR140